jgi:hypothetical protein
LQITKAKKAAEWNLRRFSSMACTICRSAWFVVVVSTRAPHCGQRRLVAMVGDGGRGEGGLKDSASDKAT